MEYLVPEQAETERLILRQFKEGDWRDLHAYYSNKEATQFTVGREFSEGDTWRVMSAMLGHWQLRGYGPYALEDKKTAKVLGTAGFWYPGDWPEPEIKWALAPEYWGQGYASEAARAVQKIAHEYIPEIPLISFIHPDNKASIQLALAVGATLESTMLFREAKWHAYRHPST